MTAQNDDKVSMLVKYNHHDSGMEKSAYVGTGEGKKHTDIKNIETVPHIPEKAVYS